ncbi:hypothetical protein FKM82_018671 [Ascaphus truei]
MKILSSCDICAIEVSSCDIMLSCCDIVLSCCDIILSCCDIILSCCDIILSSTDIISEWRRFSSTTILSSEAAIAEYVSRAGAVDCCVTGRVGTCSC